MPCIRPCYYIFPYLQNRDGIFDGDECEKVELGEEVKFQVNITLNQKICSQKNAKKVHMLQIEPLGKLKCNLNGILSSSCIYN